MKFVYFGLIPFLLTAWFVYREHYKVDSGPDPLGSKDFRNTNLVFLLIATCFYMWRFSLGAGLLTGFAVLLARYFWGSAIKTIKRHESTNQAPRVNKKGNR